MVHLHHYAGYHVHPYIHNNYTPSINITENNTINIFGGSSGSGLFGGCSTFSGGGFWGGFWNGIGLGLGNMLFGGLFGGSGLFGGLFGGGMGMMPYAGSMMPSWNFGNWGSTGNCNCTCHGKADTNDKADAGKGKKADDAGASKKADEGAAAGDKTPGSTTKTDSSTTDATVGEDKDQPKLADFINRFRKLEKAENPSRDDAKKLYDELKERVDNGPIDEKNITTNKDHYERLLDDLVKLAEEKGWDLTKADAPEDEGTETVNNANPKGEDPKLANDKQVMIGGKPTDIATLTKPDDIANMTRDEINALKPEIATAVLTKIGHTDGEDPNKVGLVSKSYNVMLLLHKSGLKVKVAHNTKSTKDDWITGTISEVDNKDGKLSYQVNCEDSGTYGLIYTVSQNNVGGNDFNIKYKDGTYSEKQLYTKPQDYKFGDKCLERDGDPVISEFHRPGYEEVPME